MTLVYCSANINYIPFLVNEMEGLANPALVQGNHEIILHFVAHRKLVN
jgi:hypothetical protein